MAPLWSLFFMEKIVNRKYIGAEKRTALYDLFLTDNMYGKPLVVFMHGYVGYKDWGCWNLMGNAIQQAGFSFAKFSLTHSGTTPEHPIKFADLEAFGNGGYLKEVRDLQFFLNHLENEHGFKEFILVGHSRGGGDVLLVGADERVKQVHCLAPICDIASRFPKGDNLDKWKQSGVYFHKNSRTGDNLPHYFIQYEDFLNNTEELNIEKACKNLDKPVFVYHGDEDTSVLSEEGRKVAGWTKGTFYLIPGTAHTFDTKEPWTEKEMPTKFKEVVTLMLDNFTV